LLNFLLFSRPRCHPFPSIPTEVAVLIFWFSSLLSLPLLFPGSAVGTSLISLLAEGPSAAGLVFFYGFFLAFFCAFSVFPCPLFFPVTFQRLWLRLHPENTLFGGFPCRLCPREAERFFSSFDPFCPAFLLKPARLTSPLLLPQHGLWSLFRFFALTPLFLDPSFCLFWKIPPWFFMLLFYFF